LVQIIKRYKRLIKTNKIQKERSKSIESIPKKESAQSKYHTNTILDIDSVTIAFHIQSSS